MINPHDLLKLVHKNVGEDNFLQLTEAKCSGCGNCVVVCPAILWKLKDKHAQLDENYKEKCLECGACYHVCDSRAIEFDFPRGGCGIMVKFG
jgi:ferredoxin like protein